MDQLLKDMANQAGKKTMNAYQMIKHNSTLGTEAMRPAMSSEAAQADVLVSCTVVYTGSAVLDEDLCQACLERVLGAGHSRQGETHGCWLKSINFKLARFPFCHPAHTLPSTYPPASIARHTNE